MDSLAERGAAALRAGDRAAARALLGAALHERPDDAVAWLWLSGAVDEPARQRYCLERTLALDPSNAAARRGLEELTERGEMERGTAGEPGSETQAPVSRLPPSPAAPSAVAPTSERARHATLSGALPWLAAAMAGMSAALAWAAWARLGEQASTVAVVWAAAAGGVPLGLAALLLGGVLLRTSGRWLGGGAGAAQVRSALGWAVAPAAFGLGLWGAQLALASEAALGGGAASPAQQLLLSACTAAHSGLWLWSTARSVVALAAAHGITRARAAASWLLAALIVGAGIVGVLGGSALIIGMRGG